MAPVIPPACRSGEWYLGVARLLDHNLELEFPSLGFDSSEAALAGALKQPDDIAVLVRVAQVSALGRRIELPPNACERARAVAEPLFEGQESARYVCARAAIADGNAAQAKASLDAIISPSSWDDFELARAQVAKLTNNRGATVRHAHAAIANAKQLGMRTASNDRDAIIRIATQLATGK